MVRRERRTVRSNFALLALLLELKNKNLLPVQDGNLHKFFARFLTVLKRRWIDTDTTFMFTSEGGSIYSMELKAIILDWMGKDVVTYQDGLIDLARIDEDEWRKKNAELGDYAVRLAATDAISYFLHNS